MPPSSSPTTTPKTNDTSADAHDKRVVHIVDVDGKRFGATFLPNPPPCDKLNIILAADESGSMSLKAPLKNGRTDGEATATFMQLQRQCMKGMLSVLPDDASIKLIGFSTAVRTLVSGDNLGRADDPNSLRNQTTQKLGELHTQQQTNTWGAICAGLDMAERDTTIMVLSTDGEPTVSPAEGELSCLLRHPNLSRFRLLVIAITNERMDLTLMHKLTAATQGLLIYVSDPSMAATTVINAGLLLAKLQTAATVSLDTTAAILPNGLAFCPTLLQQGRRTALAYIDCMPPDATLVEADDEAAVLFECMRARYAQGLMVMHECAKSAASWKRRELPGLHESLASDIGVIAEALSKRGKSERACKFTDELEGEVALACDPAHVDKWGCSFLLWLAHVHHAAYYSDFRNESVKVYQRDDLDDALSRGTAAFNQSVQEVAQPVHIGGIPHFAPPPAPTANRPPVDFTQYYDRGGGCLTADTIVWTACGPRRVDALRAGDALVGGEVVRCVTTTTAATGRRMICRIRADVALTEHHPVSLAGGGWTWPKTLTAPAIEEASLVYNLLLDRGHELVLGARADVRAVTLAHGRSGHVLAHDLYGTTAIVDILKGLSGWNLGRVNLEAWMEQSYNAAHPYPCRCGHVVEVM